MYGKENTTTTHAMFTDSKEFLCRSERSIDFSDMYTVKSIIYIGLVHIINLRLNEISL